MCQKEQKEDIVLLRVGGTTFDTVAAGDYLLLLLRESNFIVLF